MVQIKINEIKKSIKKREKDFKLKKAMECENKGDIWVVRGLYQKAAKKYKKAIHYAKDQNPEQESILQLKLGKLYFDKLKDYLNARIYLVDF